MKTTDDTPTPGMGASSRSSRWRAWVLLVIVFALGSATGIGAGGIWLRSKVKATLADPYSVKGLPLQRMEKIESRLARELDLSEEERAQLQGVFEDAAGEYRELRKGFLDELREFSKITYDRLEEALPPEKRSDFRQLSAEGVVPWAVKSNESP